MGWGVRIVFWVLGFVILDSCCSWLERRLCGLLGVWGCCLQFWGFCCQVVALGVVRQLILCFLLVGVLGWLCGVFGGWG